MLLAYAHSFFFQMNSYLEASAVFEVDSQSNRSSGQAQSFQRHAGRVGSWVASAGSGEAAVGPEAPHTNCLVETDSPSQSG